jgi:RNA polymerase sigma-70 factor (ECF subfamily)
MRGVALSSDNEALDTATEAGVLERLFEAHHGRVWAYAARRVGPDDAYDVLSETFLIAFRRLRDKPKDELPWLLAIARRVCANQLRSSRRQDALRAELKASSIHGAHPPADDVVDAVTLSEAFRSLDQGDREILMLTSWDGLSPRMAAKVLGCSPTTFAVRLHRARRKLLRAVETREHSDEGRDAVIRPSTGRSSA